MRQHTARTAFALLAVLAANANAKHPAGLDANGHLKPVAVAAAAFSYSLIEHGVQVRVGNVTKNVIFYGPSTVRVSMLSKMLR